MTLVAKDSKDHEPIFYMEVSFNDKRTVYEYVTMEALRRAYMYLVKCEHLTSNSIDMYKMYRGDKMAITPGLWI